MRQWSVIVATLALIAILADSARGQVSRLETTTQIRKEFVLGRHLAEDLERKDGRINDRAVGGYVQAIANRLARATGRKAFEVRITQGSDWYAYLLPKGMLYISGSLFERIENEAELAGLLAHQLAHMQRPISPAQGRSTTALPQRLCVLAPQIAPTVWTGDRRASELLATKAAVETLRMSGYDPSAVLDLLSKLAYEQPAWAKAIFSKDLLDLRVMVEGDAVPEDGYRMDSSEFVEQHATVVLALEDAANNRPAPDRTSLPRH